ncbi:MAG: holo-ACP synthase [Candidatus Accumulibacter sp.]|jgi:holo-[acyl-carrier protein] synthase|nr:holo-ACP synthase [Accumulibacter sp.]
MIAGVGADIVAVARLARLYQRHGSRATEKLLAPSEFAEFSRTGNRARFLAKRFAAKEAFGKALGIGVAPPAGLTSIAVTHDALGKPAFAYAPPLARYLAERGLAAHLSISDEADYALAFVVLESA